MPHVLKHAVDVHLVDAERVEVQYALLDIRYVRAADGHFRAAIRELLQPQRDVLHHVVVGTEFLLRLGHDATLHVRRFPDAVEVVLALRTVDGDADGEVVAVLADEALHLVGVVVDAVGGEREAVRIEPVVAAAEHLCLQVVTNPVDEVYLEERLTADEVPHYALLRHLRLMVEDVVNGLPSHLEGHPLFRVLPHEVAVLASQLTVLGDNEGDAFRRLSILERFIVFDALHCQTRIYHRIPEFALHEFAQAPLQPPLQLPVQPLLQ